MVLVVKNQPANVGDIRDAGLISGLGRSPGGGHGNPLQYSCLENPTDREAWQAASIGSHRVGHNWNNLARTSFALKWVSCRQHIVGSCRRFLKKLKTELSHDSEIPLLGIYLEKMKTLIWKHTCTPMFTAALFTTARHGSNFCPFDRWIDK